MITPRYTCTWKSHLHLSEAHRAMTRTYLHLSEAHRAMSLASKVHNAVGGERKQLLRSTVSLGCRSFHFSLKLESR